MSLPLFSIITPVYNREKCIDVAIESVLQQNFSSWEMILVDDGSTDATAAVCRRYADRDWRIRYYYKSNGGVSSARNAGVNQARGEYILFLDSDDRIRKDALTALNDCLSENPDTDIVCFGTEHLKEKWANEFGPGGRRIEKKEIRQTYLPTHISICSRNENFLLNYIWNKCYRKVFLQEHQLAFDEQRRTWEDGIYVVNCLDNANVIQIIPDALHLGCDDPAVDHLSSKVYKDQLRVYIQDEKEFKKRFECEYDFANEYYCRSNFQVLNRLFERYAATYKADARELIEEALNEPIVSLWCEHVQPENRFEMRMLDAIKCQDAKAIYALYDTSIIGRGLRRLRTMLAHK